ncbi:MAG: helical backbone metal receptor [Candidatus Omnitrophota bacterium]
MLFKGRYTVLFLLFLAVCFPPKAFTLESARTADPARIVSLGPGITEELYLLGLEDKIVGVTTYCRRVPAGAQKVAAAVDMSIEKVAALKPDLVLATAIINPKGVEKLKNLGIRVVVFPAARSFEQLCAQFMEMGVILGKEKEAALIVRKARGEVDSVKRSVAGFARPGVIVQAGAKPLWVAPRDSFINDFVEMAGGVNLGPAGESGGYSREKVLKLNPEVIIITTMGIVGDEEKSLWEKYANLAAVKNKRIYIVDSDKFCSPTPESFVSTLKETAALLHPENE